MATDFSRQKHHRSSVLEEACWVAQENIALAAQRAELTASNDLRAHQRSISGPDDLTEVRFFRCSQLRVMPCDQGLAFLRRGVTGFHFSGRALVNATAGDRRCAVTTNHSNELR